MCMNDVELPSPMDAAQSTHCSTRASGDIDNRYPGVLGFTRDRRLGRTANACHAVAPGSQRGSKRHDVPFGAGEGVRVGEKKNVHFCELRAIRSIAISISAVSSTYLSQHRFISREDNGPRECRHRVLGAVAQHLESPRLNSFPKNLRQLHVVERIAH